MTPFIDSFSDIWDLPIGIVTYENDKMRIAKFYLPETDYSFTIQIDGKSSQEAGELANLILNRMFPTKPVLPTSVFTRKMLQTLKSFLDLETLISLPDGCSAALYIRAFTCRACLVPDVATGPLEAWMEENGVTPRLDCLREGERCPFP